MPTHPDPRCPTCNEAMEEGFILDHGQMKMRHVSEWVKGAPKRSFWNGVKAQVRKAIVAFRCPKCGLVQHYALW